MTRPAMTIIPKACAAVLLAALLAACGKHVVVGSQYPAPVMAKQPYRVGLLIDDGFRRMVHEAELETGGSWRVELGEAQTALFRQIVAGMFDQALAVQSPTPGAAVDAVLRPSVRDFQFATPEQNATDYYEAWIHYRIAVHAADGRLIGHWPLKAYGRSQARALSAEGSLQEAVRVALRDAAAGMALEFPRQQLLAAAAGNAPPAAGGAAAGAAAAPPQATGRPATTADATTADATTADATTAEASTAEALTGSPAADTRPPRRRGDDGAQP